MPIKRLTVCSVLAAAMFVVAPTQATTSKTHGKPVHAKHVQHKPTHGKSAQHKSTHHTNGKLADTTPQDTHSDPVVPSADFEETVDVATAPVKSELPIPASLQASSFTQGGSPTAVNATPAWLSQSPLSNPAGMLVQSTKPTYFGSLAMAGENVAASSTPDQIDAGTQTADANGAENVTDLRKALISLAMNLRDIRYVRGGSNPSTGFDCSGFVRYVFAHAVGLQLPTNSASQFLAGLKVNRADMKPGDLVFFHTHGKSRISHVGIYISDGRFIHSPATGKSVEISSLNEAYWAKRFAGAKRPEGIAQVASKG
jgi:cell wall-associated NlpC family hydrolase